MKSKFYSSIQWYICLGTQTHPRNSPQKAKKQVGGMPRDVYLNTDIWPLLDLVEVLTSFLIEKKLRNLTSNLIGQGGEDLILISFFSSPHSSHSISEFAKFVQLAQFFKVFLAPLKILENILAHLIGKKFSDIKKKQKFWWHSTDPPKVKEKFGFLGHLSV